MSMLNKECTATYRKGVRDLLAECLHHVECLEKECSQYKEAEKYFENNQLQMKHRDLIRNLAWKIRNQRRQIKELMADVMRERHNRATVTMMWNRIKKDATARDVLYEKVRHAANNGDVIRILALLD